MLHALKLWCDTTGKLAKKTNTAVQSRCNLSIPKTSTLLRYQPFDKGVLNQQTFSAVIAYKNLQPKSHMSILMFQCH